MEVYKTIYVDQERRVQREREREWGREIRKENEKKKINC